jgi:FkbM family methyltransferase
MNLPKILDSVHQNLAKSPFAVNLAIKLHNQCKSIIKYHLGESKYLDKNGEGWLARQIAAHSTTFIDVGANLGEWTEIFYNEMSNNRLGLLFDPSPLAFQNLQNKFKNIPEIELINAAVSDIPGEMNFYENLNSFDKSSLVGDNNNSNLVKTKVKVTTLDIEITKRQLDYIDFLKIDAEGYDFHVLRGASNLLSRQLIGVIQFEYIGAWALANSTLIGAINLLKSYGYQIFLLKSSGLYKFDYDLYQEYFSYSNFVAISPAKFNLIESFIQSDFI